MLHTAALLAALGSLSACADAVVNQDPATPAEVEASGDLKTGWIWRHGADRPIEVSYEVRNGLAMWQGDIILGKAGEVPATRQALEGRVRQGGPRLGLGIAPGSGRWPLGTVAYVIDPALPNAARVTDAIGHIESKWTYLDFTSRGTETDYVYITAAGAGANDCASYVGRTGGQQVLLLGSNCTKGNTIHELLHAVGMEHEQNRCDRDLRLTIKWANMRDAAEPYFQKLCDGFDEYGTYDYSSIMHGHRLIESINNLNTLEPKPYSSSNLNKMGQRDSMSTRDVQTIQSMYPRPLGPTGVTVTLSGSTPVITWNAVAGASYYSVELLQRYEENDYERGYSSYDSYSLIGTTGGTSMADTGNPYT
ncbi:MAG TPA: M12 family metallopeptidase, partial [Longimicrobium sp.]|nr:M12 family metallopeptidase [Longimicrobium sp.]